MDLPFALPATVSSPGEAESQPDAQVTGIEITYNNDERAIVSSGADTFDLMTVFKLSHPIVPDLLSVAIDYSAEIGSRLFRKG